MYISTVESWIRDGVIKVYKDVDGSKQLSQIQQAYGESTIGVIRIPERGVIQQALAVENGLSAEDKIHALLMKSVVDDPKHLADMMRFGTPLKNTTTLIECGTHIRISHSDALDRLRVINEAIREKFNEIEAGDNYEIHGSFLDRIRGLTEDTFLSEMDDAMHDDEINDELDEAGKVMHALREEGRRGLIVALSAFGMYGTDITKMTGIKRGVISSALTKWLAAKPEYAWIAAKYNAYFENGFKRGRKYTKDDLDIFARIFCFFANETEDDDFNFDCDFDVLDRRAAQ